MKLWILVYSPITNENIIKLAYFKTSYRFEQFVLDNKDSIITRHYETICFDLDFEVE